MYTTPTPYAPHPRPAGNGFLALLAEQIEVAESAAGANDYLDRPEIADWWRGRAAELRRYLEHTRLEEVRLSPGLG